MPTKGALKVKKGDKFNKTLKKQSDKIIDEYNELHSASYAAIRDDKRDKLVTLKGNFNDLKQQLQILHNKYNEDGTLDHYIKPHSVSLNKLNSYINFIDGFLENKNNEIEDPLETFSGITGIKGIKGGKRRTRRRRQRSNKKRTNKRKKTKTRMKKRKTSKRKTNKRRRKR